MRVSAGLMLFIALVVIVQALVNLQGAQMKEDATIQAAQMRIDATMTAVSK